MFLALTLDIRAQNKTPRISYDPSQPVPSEMQIDPQVKNTLQERPSVLDRIPFLPKWLAIHTSQKIGSHMWVLGPARKIHYPNPRHDFRFQCQNWEPYS